MCVHVCVCESLEYEAGCVQNVCDFANVCVCVCVCMEYRVWFVVEGGSVCGVCDVRVCVCVCVSSFRV